MLTRETISLAVPVLVIIIGVALMTACPQPPSPTPVQTIPAATDESGSTEPVMADESGDPIELDINLSDPEILMLNDVNDASAPNTAPEDIQYKVNLANNFLRPDEPYNMNFRYEALVYRGMRTYLLNDPDDLTSGYVSDENGPIYYYVLESEPGKLESDELSNDAEFDYWFVPPEDTYVIRYWVEIVVEKGHDETDFAQVPWISPDEVIPQGRLITEEDID